jgi:hypothetical protein
MRLPCDPSHKALHPRSLAFHQRHPLAWPARRGPAHAGHARRPRCADGRRAPRRAQVARDDRIKKRMSIRYADISGPLGVPDVPALVPTPGAPRATGVHARMPSELGDDEAYRCACSTTRISTRMSVSASRRVQWDGSLSKTAVLKAKLANSTEAELQSLQSSLRIAKTDCDSAALSSCTLARRSACSRTRCLSSRRGWPRGRRCPRSSTSTTLLPLSVRPRPAPTYPPPACPRIPAPRADTTRRPPAQRAQLGRPPARAVRRACSSRRRPSWGVQPARRVLRVREVGLAAGRRAFVPQLRASASSPVSTARPARPADRARRTPPRSRPTTTRASRSRRDASSARRRALLATQRCSCGHGARLRPSPHLATSSSSASAPPLTRCVRDASDPLELVHVLLLQQL